VKVAILLLLFSILLNAKNYTLELYESILIPLFGSNPVVVYADRQSAEILDKSNKFKVLRHCTKDTQLLVGANFKTLEKVCQDKPLFATSSRVYKENKNAFGAFYWVKGRPQVYFKPDRLQKFHIELTDDLKGFLDE